MANPPNSNKLKILRTRAVTGNEGYQNIALEGLQNVIATSGLQNSPAAGQQTSPTKNQQTVFTSPAAPKFKKK